MDILNKKLKELISNDIDPDNSYTIDVINILISDNNWKQDTNKLDLVYNHLLSLVKDKFEDAESNVIDLLYYLIKYDIEQDKPEFDLMDLILNLWFEFRTPFETIDKFKEYFCNIYDLNDLFNIALNNVMDNEDLKILTKSEAIESYYKQYKSFIDKLLSIDNLLDINFINKILDRKEI